MRKLQRQPRRDCRFRSLIVACRPDDGDFAMSDALLIPRVMKILLSLPAAKIDFWAHGMHVSGGGYGMVWPTSRKAGYKLRTARLASQIDQRSGSAVRSQYSHPAGFRRDSYGSAPDERALVLHECTHALRDIMASPGFRTEGCTAARSAGSCILTTRRRPTLRRRSSTSTTTAPSGRSVKATRRMSVAGGKRHRARTQGDKRWRPRR